MRDEVNVEKASTEMKSLPNLPKGRLTVVVGAFALLLLAGLGVAGQTYRPVLAYSVDKMLNTSIVEATPTKTSSDGLLPPLPGLPVATPTKTSSDGLLPPLPGLPVATPTKTSSDGLLPPLPGLPVATPTKTSSDGLLPPLPGLPVATPTKTSSDGLLP